MTFFFFSLEIKIHGPHEDLLTIVKRPKLQWYGHLPFVRSGQKHLARHNERGKKTRQTEEEVGSCLLYTSDANYSLEWLPNVRLFSVRGKGVRFVFFIVPSMVDYICAFFAFHITCFRFYSWVIYFAVIIIVIIIIIVVVVNVVIIIIIIASLKYSSSRHEVTLYGWQDVEVQLVYHLFNAIFTVCRCCDKLFMIHSCLTYRINCSDMSFMLCDLISLLPVLARTDSETMQTFP